VRPLGWRRALKADLPALCAFLKADEERRVGFSGRLLRDGELKLPPVLRGAVWLADAPESSAAAGQDHARAREARALAGAILCHPSRLVFPIFPRTGEADRDIGLLARYFSPASIIGMAPDVLRYESIMGVEPLAAVKYLMMSHNSSGGPAAPIDAPRAYPSLSLRRATVADLDVLMPLQEAYEREEVLTSIHEFNRQACRASLARALERQLMFVAEDHGVIVGKAATNARGFAVDQIGGVYTIPERRGRGVARALVSALLAESGRAGRRAALFVKPTNAPARNLYLGLGFEDSGEYRADYFEA
jgi:ribosomal protein S18 acetylase RimI-like enzyme